MHELEVLEVLEFAARGYWKQLGKLFFKLPLEELKWVR